jgi:hypothetical protein
MRAEPQLPCTQESTDMISLGIDGERPPFYVSKAEAIKFWKRVRKTDNCWLFYTRANMEKHSAYAFLKKSRLVGRNRKSYRRGNVAAHQVAYYLTYGKNPPDGHVILRTCHIRNCVNPDHFFVGTKAEVTKKTYELGISKIGGLGDESFVRQNREKLLIGSQCKSAKLNETRVRCIKMQHMQGESSNDLAKEYGVSYATIYAILTGRSWNHVEITDFQYVKQHARGSSNHGSKLTEDMVHKLRYFYNQGISTEQLSQWSKVKLPTIESVVRGRTWKHINGYASSPWRRVHMLGNYCWVRGNMLIDGVYRQAEVNWASGKNKAKTKVWFIHDTSNTSAIIGDPNGYVDLSEAKACAEDHLDPGH